MVIEEYEDNFEKHVAEEYCLWGFSRLKKTNYRDKNSIDI